MRITRIRNDKELGMAKREVDPVMMDAYRAPFPDYWSRVGMLAFQRDIPLSDLVKRTGIQVDRGSYDGMDEFLTKVKASAPPQNTNGVMTKPERVG